MPDRRPSSPSAGAVVGCVITALLIVSPVAAIAVSVPLLWGHAIHLRDVVLAAILYAVTGHGVTVGFHRLFTHRGFTPKRPLKIALAIAGSMAIEGSGLARPGWPTTGATTCTATAPATGIRPGVPSPRGCPRGPVCGLLHAPTGWNARGTDTTAPERYAAYALRDPRLRRAKQALPALGRRLPGAAGSGSAGFWLGSLIGGLTAFVWAGIIRMALLHHVTWSVNSICHMVGARPFATDDQSRNVRLLSPSSPWASHGTTCTTPTRPAA